MPTRDGLKYPDKLDVILADRDLGPIFRNWCEVKSYCSENVDFLDDVKSGKSYQRLYNTYISPTARKELNISDTRRDDAIELAEQGNWQPREWQEVISGIMKDVRNLMNSQIGNFYASEMFKKYHLKNLRSKIKVNDRQLEELGVDKKNKEQLVDMLVLFQSDKKAGEKAAAVLSKRRKSSLNPNELVAKLRKMVRFR